MPDLAIVYSRAQNGIGAPLVRVNANLSNGLLRLSIVGNINPYNQYLFLIREQYILNGYLTY